VPNPASIFYGAAAHGKRWKAQITYGGKNHHIGAFDTMQEAALAYTHTPGQQGCLCMMWVQSRRSPVGHQASMMA
jgi:hypothetical protein